MSALAAVEDRSWPNARRLRSRRWDEPPVLLALAVMLIAVLALGLLLAPSPPADDSSEAGFARDMATHHEQAVRMAELALQRTNDSEIRVLATDIAASQRHQIGLMRGWLEAWGRPVASVQPAMAWMDHPATAMPGMASAAGIARLQRSRGPAADEQLLRLMIPHHQGGVLMAEAALERAGRPEVRSLAGKIVAGQQAEITAMQDKLRRMGKPTVQGTVSMPAGGHGEHGATATSGGTHASGHASPSISRELARLGPLVLGLVAVAWLGADTLPRRWAFPADPSSWRLLAAGGLGASSVLHIGLVGQPDRGPVRAAILTTKATPLWPAACTHTCAGATPTPATPTSWPRNAANAPASAVSASNAGVAPEPKPPDHTRRTFRDSAH